MRVPHSAARVAALAAHASSPCARLSLLFYSSHSHLAACLPRRTRTVDSILPDRARRASATQPSLPSLQGPAPQSSLARTKSVRHRTRMGGTHTTPCSPSRRPLSLPKRKPHAAPSTRLPQYSLDEEVRIVCYSPPLPKKRRGMCVVALAQCVATHPPLLRVVPPPPPVQMRKVVTLTSSPG